VTELPQALLGELISHAKDGAPEEVCGWLAGKGDRVFEIYPVPNAAEDPESRFRMEPGAQLAAMRGISRRALELIGTYHSHPKTPPCPSARDRELALYPDSAHLIISLAAPEPEIRCWRITETGVDQFRLVVYQEALR
jgi:proteasome lid subunit RPN8/RPN11